MEDLQIAEMQEQNEALKTALESLLNDVEATDAHNVDEVTVERLSAAGYEFTPNGPTWDYTITCDLGGIIEPDDRIMTHEDAVSVAFDRLQEDLTDIVLKRPHELVNAFTVTVTKA